MVREKAKFTPDIKYLLKNDDLVKGDYICSVFVDELGSVSFEMYSGSLIGAAFLSVFRESNASALYCGKKVPFQPLAWSGCKLFLGVSRIICYNSRD